MGIMVTRDEADKKREGMEAERRRIARSGRSDVAEELRAREMEISQTAIRNPDPKKAYRLANKDWKGRVGVLKGKGYKITPPDDAAQLITGVELEGAQTHGDLILMEIAVEKYEASRRRKQQFHDSIAASQAEAAKDNINRIARDAGLIGPHKDAAFDDSKEN